MEQLKNLGKQGVIALILLAGLFLWKPGAVLLVAVGIVVGIVLGNWFPAVESRAESLIAKVKKR